MPPDKDLLLQMLERMWRIRIFEETVIDIHSSGELQGPAHPYIGQEAVAVGACAALKDTDYIAGNHRSHGHPIAKGGDLGGDGGCGGDVLGPSGALADIDEAQGGVRRGLAQQHGRRLAGRPLSGALDLYRLLAAASAAALCHRFADRGGIVGRGAADFELPAGVRGGGKHAGRALYAISLAGAGLRREIRLTATWADSPLR